MTAEPGARRRRWRAWLPSSLPLRSAVAAAAAAGLVLVLALAVVEDRVVAQEAYDLGNLAYDHAGRVVDEAERSGLDEVPVLSAPDAARLAVVAERSLAGTGWYEVTDAHGRVLASSPELAPFQDDGNRAVDQAVPVDDWYSRLTPTVDEPPRDILHPIDVTDDLWVADLSASSGSWYILIYLPRGSGLVGLVLELHALRWPAVGAVMLVALVAWLATQMALRPVRRMRAQAESIGADALDRRVPVPSGRHAVAGLGRSINGMLDRLQRSDSQQRRFVADAAHEIRSPLAGLRATLDVALAHPDRTDWPATVRVAAEETERLQALADDLLLLAQLETGHAGGATGVVDLGELAADEARRRGRDGVRIECRAPGPVLVEGSERHLRRLVGNLLDNALRFARTEVVVEVEVVDEPTGRRGLLSVADDGPGVPPEDVDRIFDRFVRLDAGRDRAAGGAGLGLALAREIAAAHDGSLTARPGPGGRFTLGLLAL